MTPFQIVFNPVSAVELSKLPKDLQLYVLGEFRGLPSEIRKNDLGKYGKLERDHVKLCRFRLKDYRIYFEMTDIGVVVHRILSKNTLKDFLYRSSLPTGEDKALEESPKFWELIEKARSEPAGS